MVFSIGFFRLHVAWNDYRFRVFGDPKTQQKHTKQLKKHNQNFTNGVIDLELHGLIAYLAENHHGYCWLMFGETLVILGHSRVSPRFTTVFRKPRFTSFFRHVGLHESRKMTSHPLFGEVAESN